MARAVSLHAAGADLRKERAESILLTAGHGAVGDRHAGRDPERALLVTSASTYDYLERQGIVLEHGSLGENIVVEGLIPEKLPEGTRLVAGEVVLELTGPCTVCSSLSVLDLRLPKLSYGRRGVYARVVRGGSLREGDRFEVEPGRNGSKRERTGNFPETAS